MKRVLIVDDEMLVRAGIRSLLDWEAHGYTIAGEASCSHEAIALTETAKPDIILTDLIMEKGNGLELISWCRENHPRIQIVALSNHTDYDKVRAAMKCGAKDFLFKLTTTGEEMIRVLDALPVDETHADDGGQAASEQSARAARQRLLVQLFKNETEDMTAWQQEIGRTGWLLTREGRISCCPSGWAIWS